jgi:hypothetical protein
MHRACALVAQVTPDTPEQAAPHGPKTTGSDNDSVPPTATEADIDIPEHPSPGRDHHTPYETDSQHAHYAYYPEWHSQPEPHYARGHTPDL